MNFQRNFKIKNKDSNQYELYENIKNKLALWAEELGFQGLGIADLDLLKAEEHLQKWLSQNFHGEMDYMQRHGIKRTRPQELLPKTIRVISVRMNYFPPSSPIADILKNPFKALIARYSLGRDYHKLIRKRLEKLAQKIKEYFPDHQYRVFCDSAPVMEKPLAEKAGLGWIGKHTNLVNTKMGSWFFLGTIYTDIPFSIDKPSKNHCGSCHRCIDVCPTQAIIAPYLLDARRCISYLTIEFKGSIPLEFRPLIKNHVFGCDDCQWVCPWNKFAKFTAEEDFQPRHQLDNSDLITLFNWTEEDFFKKTEGSAIRRIGYEMWLRNIAVALGNAPYSKPILKALQKKLENCSVLVREHIEWAIARQLEQL